MVSCYNYISVNEEWLREFVAELLGTFLLVFMGNNAVAEKVLTYGEAGSPLTIYIGYAMALFMGIIVSAGVSGAHLNPAVTVAGAFAQKFRWSKVPHYLLAQYLGSFLAACCTYLIYMDSLDSFHGENGINTTTAGIFTTFPKDGLSVTGSFVDQILGTMVLMIGIYAITDELNMKIPSHMVALYVSLILLGIGCSVGVNQGFALNPARDFSPRVFVSLTLWGGDVFSSYWFVPILGPHIGAILGACIYVVFFERFRNLTEESSDDDNNNYDSNSVHCEKKFSITKAEEKAIEHMKSSHTSPSSKLETYTVYL